MGKILFVSNISTHPTLSGGQQGIFAHFALLKKMGYDVYFFLGCVHYLASEEFNATREFWGDHFFYYKQSFFVSLIHRIRLKLHKIDQLHITKKFNYNIDIFYLLGMNRKLRKIQKIHNFDVVSVHYIWNSKAFNVFPDKKKVLYTHDVFSYRLERTGKESIHYFTTSPNEEKKALDRSDAIISVQENESIYFRFLTKKKVYTAYSPIEGENTPLTGNKNILYLGGKYSLNIESLHNFIRIVMPRLVAGMPEIKLYIAGRICEKIDKSLLNEHIILFGRVDNVKSFYELGDIAINPTERGTGLKIKSIEALSYNKVLVAHPHTVNGLFLPNNLPISLASTPEEYVDIILDFLKNPRKVQEEKEKIALYMDKYSAYIENQIKKAYSLANQIENI
jgi:hypothetical protein